MCSMHVNGWFWGGLLLLAGPVAGQSVYEQRLAVLSKQPAGPVRDSLMARDLFALSKNITPRQDDWIDSLRRFSAHRQHRLGILLWQVIDAEKGIRQLNFRDGIQKHLAFARQLEALPARQYASWSYLRAGIIFARPSSELITKADALTYYHKALSLSEAARDTTEIVRALDYIGEYWLDRNDYERAIIYLTKAERLLIKNADKYLYPTVLASLGSAYLLLNREPQARHYYAQMRYWLNNGQLQLKPFYRGYILNIYHLGYATYHFRQRHYGPAITFARQGLAAVQAFRQTNNIRTYHTYARDHLKVLYEASAQTHNWADAFHYLQEYQTIEAAHQQSDLDKRFQELNKKYQTEQKQVQIARLEQEKARAQADSETRLRYGLLGLVGLLIIGSGYVIWTNGRLRRKNRDISAALLRGQTLERGRVAADLHDNLGSTLASLNFSLAALNTSQLSPPEQTLYAAISQQLRQAYGDLRLLAHNLLPDELAKNGLPAALTGFVAKLNRNAGPRNTALRVRLDLPPDPAPLRADARTEFELYSICLELTNNALKHAQATEIQIGLVRHNQQLTLTVADNGVGLPAEADLPPTVSETGAGLQNVGARVAGLGGRWQTGPGPDGRGLLNTVTVPFREPAR
jgi:signal transduction histidine kinase